MTVLQTPHPGKALEVTHNGITYKRYPVKTDLVNADTKLDEMIPVWLEGQGTAGDVLLIAESIVAISQGRGFVFSEIKTTPLARFLAKYVTKTPAGIGLGTPETMQLAIGEVGAPRIIFGAALAAITKPFGIKGVFYHVVGEKARAIDGPTAGTLPPFNEWATLSPKNPRQFAQSIQDKLGFEVIIVDANDIGQNILGAKDKAQHALGKALCFDNPMGQGSEQTPMLLCKKELQQA